MTGGLTLGQLAAFNVAVLLAAMGPGPAFLVCVESSLRGGRRAGILTGAGLAVVAGLWTLAALLGLDALFEAVPAAYFWMRTLGALFVLALAVQTWRRARMPVDAVAAPSKRRAFLRGALLNLGNPKSILFSAGVLLVIFPPDMTAAQKGLVTLNHIALEVGVYAGLATALDRDAVRLRYLAFKPVLARVMAVVLAGLGLRLLVTS